MTDTNGVVYTTTETYYDADFATRIKRFGTQASSTRDYYDDYYTYDGGTTYVYVDSYDPFYWDYYPSFYIGWDYRPYWRTYWGWDYYWGYPWYWHNPYWAYDWGWHHPYHHHHHHCDWHHGGGHHHDGGHGGPGGGSFGNYVASVRHGNSTGGSMSRALPNNGRNNLTNSANVGGSMSRPQSANAGRANTSRPTVSSRPSSSSRPTASTNARPSNSVSAQDQRSLDRKSVV